MESVAGGERRNRENVVISMIYLLLGVGRLWANRGLDGCELPAIAGLSDQVLLSERFERLFNLLGGHTA